MGMYFLQYMCGGPEGVFQKLVLPSIVSSRIDLGWSGLCSKHLLTELSQHQSFKSFNVFFNFYDVFIRLLNKFSQYSNSFNSEVFGR